MDEQKGGKPNPGTKPDKRLSENKEFPKPSEMGHDQMHAAMQNDADHHDAWAKHDAGAASKAPPTQRKSYAAELGAALAPHAVEQGRRFRSG